MHTNQETIGAHLQLHVLAYRIAFRATSMRWLTRDKSYVHLMSSIHLTRSTMLLYNFAYSVASPYIFPLTGALNLQSPLSLHCSEQTHGQF